MNYKDVFAIDDISVQEREKTKTKKNNQFLLDNYIEYDEKLMKEFYLKYFIFKLLFKVHVLELDDFLDFHFKYAENPNKFYKVLKSIVVPQIEEIIENAMPNFAANGSPAGEDLGAGFYNNGGVIYKYMYEYYSMYKFIGGKSFTSKYKERLSIVKDFLEIDKVKREVGKIKWIAGPSKLGVIMRELVDMGYIDANMHRSEINVSELSRNLLNVFSLKDSSSMTSLAIYLNSNSEKYIEAKNKLESRDFTIPNVNFI